jgi:hypothetical protein
MIDVVDGIRELLEPASIDPAVSVNGVKLDDTGAMPFEFEAETLYVVAQTDQRTLAETIRETSDGSTEGVEQQNFSIVALYVVSGEGENSQGRRSRNVTLALDQKADDYCRLVRSHRTNGDLWHHLQAAVDHDFVRQLQIRGIAVRLTGYRFVS